MKKNMHPEVHLLQARCVCGATFDTESTAASIVVSTCSKCHRFYTKTQHFADTERRIDKFYKKYGGKPTVS